MRLIRQNCPLAAHIKLNKLRVYTKHLEDEFSFVLRSQGNGTHATDSFIYYNHSGVPCARARRVQSAIDQDLRILDKKTSTSDDCIHLDLLNCLKTFCDVLRQEEEDERLDRELEEENSENEERDY